MTSLRLSDNHLLSSLFFLGISLTLQKRYAIELLPSERLQHVKTLVWTYATALNDLTSRKITREKNYGNSVYRDFSGRKFSFLTTPALKTIHLYSWSIIIPDSVKEKFTSFRMNKPKSPIFHTIIRQFSEWNCTHPSYDKYSDSTGYPRLSSRSILWM